MGAEVRAGPVRVQPMAGASNFRDLGGHATTDGRCVRWGQVFRSDRLDHLQPPDLARLKQLGVQVAVDLRDAGECGERPYEWPGLRRHALPMTSTLASVLERTAAAGIEVDGAHMRRLMRDQYRHFVDAHVGSLRAFFALLCDTRAPVVFHCSAGKDRTGVVAALLLSSLGVSHEALMADYLLTNDLYRRPDDLQRHGRSLGLPAEALAVMWSVHESHLGAAFDAIGEAHGGVDRFLTRVVGLTPAMHAALAGWLLETPSPDGPTLPRRP